jgi:hypothetical protein
MPEVIFEEPPGAYAHARVEHTVVSRAARLRPGEWARVGAYPTPASASSIAYRINRGTLRAWSPAGAFEAVSRTVDGEHRVYARYLGEPGHAGG